jgi:hypothetical protein
MSKRFTLFLFRLIATVLIFGVPTIFGQYKGTAVTMDKLMSTVQSKELSTAEIISTIKSNGVNFEVTSRNEYQLKQAGVVPEIIDAAKTNYRDSALRYMLFENGTSGFVNIVMTWEAATKEKITFNKDLASGATQRISFPANASDIRLSIMRDARTRDADFVMDGHQVERDEMNRCLHLTHDERIFIPCK